MQKHHLGYLVFSAEMFGGLVNYPHAVNRVACHPAQDPEMTSFLVNNLVIICRKDCRAKNTRRQVPVDSGAGITIRGVEIREKVLAIKFQCF